MDAVDYLGDNGILHRDLKDENVIIDENFRIKLIDFGSVAFHQPGKRFNTFFGTIEYCSPEVLEGNKYEGPEIEAWSLGVLLFIIVFSENPFYNIEETIKCNVVLPYHVSAECEALLRSIMERDPAKRLTIKQIKENSWVQMALDITQYCFEDVIQCCECPLSRLGFELLFSRE